MENYIQGIGVTAGSMMLKWDLLNQHIHNHPIHIDPGDKINVFINFESILRNISLYKDINGLVNFHKQNLTIELESAILNMIANYRMYFMKSKAIPQIYLYHTSLESTTQQMSVYNEFYRSYYHNRYMQNPQFRKMGELLRDIIINELKLIISYIPGCYFIETSVTDGSIIPLVIAGSSDCKNVIITSDVFDTLYLFKERFITIYIKRRYSNFNVISTIDNAIQSIIRGENPLDLTIFNSELYYRLLLSIKGSKIRNIQSAKGFGYGKFLKTIKEGMDNGVILRDFESIHSILELFPLKYRDDIKNAFQCTSLETQYELLGDVDTEYIRSQVIDKFDPVSIEALNNKRFLNFPINIQGLT